ncbi:uncharacterized protein LOC144450836 isoform X1 [Glandiceps talaboti]
MDIIEGRSLAAVADQIEDIQDDVDDLDDRVTTTEGNVHKLNQTVEEQQNDIKTVKEDVKEQEERIDQLEEVVDETVEKVEEIDHKTLSAAPAWSKDVSNVLNINSDYDWRFLAIRLGYGSEDIRNWATAHDPTMSLLSEWYTTHKGADATYAVLTSLKEMGRNDCVDIIESALKAADEMIPQAPPELTHPPPVFISYQWDHQSEVKILKEYLGKAGYDCWMDIGQMGGGDQLYQKIDEGLRGAKVVLSMVTNKYAQSKNCNHEVNLANLLNKPIIPLLLEDVEWPPPGPMSVLFSQLLYIKFCAGNERKEGEPFWQDSNFAELLGQINIHVAPNSDKIPNGESVEEDTSQTRDQVEKIINDSEVFISYQWDKQPQVKTLYSRLTSLGYTCWFDVMQMGGGDNLYSQIERGIRKAKVVICCCTSKYALSVNCRREVSSADALKKPLIPVVLENMAWPPEGPMALPFTQLLYIDFSNDESQKNFDDSNFEELLQKLGSYVQRPENNNGNTKLDEFQETTNEAEDNSVRDNISESVITTNLTLKEEQATEDSPKTTLNRDEVDEDNSVRDNVFESSMAESTTETHLPPMEEQATEDSPKISLNTELDVSQKTANEAEDDSERGSASQSSMVESITETTLPPKEEQPTEDSPKISLNTEFDVSQKTANEAEDDSERGTASQSSMTESITEAKSPPKEEQPTEDPMITSLPKTSESPLSPARKPSTESIVEEKDTKPSVESKSSESLQTNSADSAVEAVILPDKQTPLHAQKTKSTETTDAPLPENKTPKLESKVKVQKVSQPPVTKQSCACIML